MIYVILFQVVLIFFNAVFASAEIAVLSMNEAKLEKMAEEGSGKAKRLCKLIKEPAKFLATIQVAITLSGFLGSAFAADSFSDPLVNWLIGLGVKLPRATLDAIAVVVITLILSYFTLIFGELVPKRLAMKKSEKIAMGISGLVSGISVAFRPIVWLLSVSTNGVLRLIGIDPHEEDEEVSEEEIRMMVDVGSEKGAIEHEEKELIQNVFEFNDTVASDIVRHRIDVAILWMEDDVSVWEETIHRERHTLYPLCNGTADDVVGILNAKDYFRLQVKDKETILQVAVHPAYFVPETIKADLLFRNMKKTRNSLAVVLDEYGGMEGIVTLYDLIEELVGELHEESVEEEAAEPSLWQTDEDTWQLTGNIRLDLLEEATGLVLATEDYDTFTGLVFDALGAIPEDGDCEIDLELEGLQVQIHKIEAHQIELATVIRKERPAEPTEE